MSTQSDRAAARDTKAHTLHYDPKLLEANRRKDLPDEPTMNKYRMSSRLDPFWTSKRGVAVLCIAALVIVGGVVGGAVGGAMSGKSGGSSKSIGNSDSGAQSSMSSGTGGMSTTSSFINGTSIPESSSSIVTSAQTTSSTSIVRSLSAQDVIPPTTRLGGAGIATAR